MAVLIIYITCFSFFCVGILVWTLERRERRYRLSGGYQGDSLLPAAITFISTYLTNFLLFFTRGAGYVFWLDLAILGLLGAFLWLKEKSYKEEVEELRQGRINEAAALEAALLKDPANTACRESLAELYKTLGEFKKALLHAQEAFRMDPIEKNRWQIKTLQSELEERSARKD
ncbi:MAG: hypothetical protein A2270_08395 [Elusimicrobia bacterium RIFOXYA12_FULL_51_18]|nr:MAG: hypothetical protein A2270_08395 [Elusimicrobia bacterium RIFOXYA12_FULL_51_18]OGS28766.1 MAG: hypothetical protein A2218_11405 [Elusimicrobia bacterium RIFOXYA2_FULL_53_38]